MNYPTNPVNFRDAWMMVSIPRDTETILEVGCGEGRLSWHLTHLGFEVFATDLEKHAEFPETLAFYRADIFKPTTFPLQRADVVICSEVLEHLEDFPTAFRNLVDLADRKVIITVPCERAFDDLRPPPEGHCNYWTDHGMNGFRDVSEFQRMTDHHVTVRRTTTKKRDHRLGWESYIITVEK